MLGPPVGQQDRLFYDFCLEDVVPADHLLRKIDAVLELSWLRGELKAHYSDIGRPSICPELMIRMLLVGYCYSIRPERRLCQGGEAQLRVQVVVWPWPGGPGFRQSARGSTWRALK